MDLTANVAGTVADLRSSVAVGEVLVCVDELDGLTCTWATSVELLLGVVGVLTWPELAYVGISRVETRGCSNM